MNSPQPGHEFRVTGADKASGEDVELVIRARDADDAARIANRQGVFISGCVAVTARGSMWVTDDAGRTAGAAAPAGVGPAGPARPVGPAASAGATAAGKSFAEAVMHDPVVRRLLKKSPQLGYRLTRLGTDDLAYLSNLTTHLDGISFRDAEHMARLIRDNRHLSPE